METTEQAGLWSSLGTHGALVVIWLLYISINGETRKFYFLSQIWPWRSRSIAPKTIEVLTKVFSTFGPNSVVLAWTGDELSHGQAQNGVNYDFQVKFDLEGQVLSPHKTIRILTKVFCTYGPNLAILAWTGDKLSHGQTWWRTDRQFRQLQYPETRVKMNKKET